MHNPEGIKALVAEAAGCITAAFVEGWPDALADGNIERIRDLWERRMSFALPALESALESLTAVAGDSRAITALKVTLFETECYLPASIAKRVQAACTVGVAGDAEGVAWELLADEERGPICDYGTVHRRIAHRAIRRALNTRQAFETMPAPAPDCDTRHAVTFYFNDKAAAEQFRTREAVEGMVKCADCSGLGGVRWQEADGSENGEKCDACDGFGGVSILVPDELRVIGELIRTQDNRITDSPIFIVQQKRTIAGVDTDYGGELVWVDNDSHEVTDPTEAAELEAYWAEHCVEPDGYTRTGKAEIWEFVTACFTEQGCKDYLARDGHNLKEPRIYAAGSYRNEEFRAVRKFLMSLAAAAPQAGKGDK